MGIRLLRSKKFISDQYIYNKEKSMMKFYTNIVLTLIFFLISPLSTYAQGPNLSMYYDPGTELPWAECYVYLEGGTKMKIPFLPVVDQSYCGPFGTNRYTNDIDVDGQLVYINNGIINNDENCYLGRRLDYTYGELDVRDKVVIFCYDFPGAEDKRQNIKDILLESISNASKGGALGAILFSYSSEYPSLRLHSANKPELLSFPVITITKESAVAIFGTSESNVNKIITDWEKKGGSDSFELISKIHIHIDGEFSKVNSPNFSIIARKGMVSGETLKNMSEINERSLKLIKKTFEPVKDNRWNLLNLTYFADFDSKIYYTRHWGFGLANDAGVFSVLKGGESDYRLAAHENTHIFTYLNWGKSSSFFTEGLGKYVEVLTGNNDQNHEETLEFILNEDMFPLSKMIDYQIGRPGKETLVGYPASGSLIGFIADQYGLAKVKSLYMLERSRVPAKDNANEIWKKVIEKDIVELEKDWHTWLIQNFRK